MEMAAAEPERLRRIIKIIYGGKAFWAEDRDALVTALRGQASAGDTVWFKASRGMKFEEIIEKFNEEK